MTWGTKPPKVEEAEQDNNTAWPEPGDCKVAEKDEEDDQYTSCCFHVRSISYVIGFIEMTILAIIIILLCCALRRAGRTYSHHEIDDNLVPDQDHKNHTASPEPDPSEKKNQAKPFDEKEIDKKTKDESWKPQDEVIFFIERRPIKCRKSKKLQYHPHRQRYRYYTYLMGHPVNQEMIVAALLWFTVCAGAVGVMLHGLMQRNCSHMIPYLALRGLSLTSNIIALMVFLMLAFRHPNATRFGCKFFWGTLITLLNGYAFHVTKSCCQYVADKDVMDKEKKEKDKKEGEMA